MWTGHTAHAADTDASAGIYEAVHFPPSQELKLSSSHPQKGLMHIQLGK